MNEKIQIYEFSEDEILDKAIKQVKKGSTYEEVRTQFDLSEDDIELIDFVINEF